MESSPITLTFFLFPPTPPHTHTFTHAAGIPMSPEESEHEAMQQFDCSAFLAAKQNMKTTVGSLALQVASGNMNW